MYTITYQWEIRWEMSPFKVCIARLDVLRDIFGRESVLEVLKMRVKGQIWVCLVFIGQ